MTFCFYPPVFFLPFCFVTLQFLHSAFKTQNLLVIRDSSRIPLEEVASKIRIRLVVKFSTKDAFGSYSLYAQ